MSSPNQLTSSETVPAGSSVSPAIARWIFVGICVLFLALRVPVMYRQPGGQDEDCYAAPGWVILQSGVPQLPHVPAINEESVYYHAEKQLYSEPPLYFYFQSLFYAVLPAQYGTGRVASAAAAIGGLLVLYGIGILAGCRPGAVLWAVGLFSISRWFLFPATSARMDILCTVFGLLCVLLMSYWNKCRDVRLLWATGVCIGLGGLTHPFAIVYAIQVAVWVALSERGWKRLLQPLMIAAISVVVVMIWVPLILQHVDVFRMQFRNQYFHDAGGGMLLRFLMPWESIRYHWFEPQGMIPHIGIWQILLTFVPLTLTTVESLWTRDYQRIPICVLAWSSIYLMSAIVGPHHPVIGYWSYTASLMFLCTGIFVERLVAGWKVSKPASRWAIALVVSSLLLASMIPGAGLRTLLVLVERRHEIEYNAPEFARRLVESLPEDAVVAVDTQFVLDFLVRGRKVILAAREPMYIVLEQYPYDYLIISRHGLEVNLMQGLPVVLERTIGNRDDLFACYCEIYRRVALEPAEEAKAQ